MSTQKNKAASRMQLSTAINLLLLIICCLQQLDESKMIYILFFFFCDKVC
ncbi:hypothetical protein [Staphylococcus sp. EZ-P03]|nr:hypothetical protein [Staphylococcus sp. EZ-P03]